MQDLPSLLLAYGINLKKSGNEYVALCINHDDRNPSMSIYINGDGRHKAHCFSCGYHQGIVGVYCTLNGLDVENKEHIKQAYAALDGEIYTGKPFATIENDTQKIVARSERIMLKPPKNAYPKMDWLQSKDGTQWGDPAEVFTFRDTDGEPLMYEARWNIANTETGEIKKECRCFTWGKRGSAPAKWECSHHLPPRPLYGLDMLAQYPDAQVIITEGPRKAAYAQKLLPGLPCIGWAGGANGWNKSDWSVITRRNVILWPDNDDPGRKCMEEIAQQLISQNCNVFMLDTSAMPESWDAADACAEGWDTDKTLAWAKSVKGEQIEKKTVIETVSEEPPEIELPPVESYTDLRHRHAVEKHAEAFESAGVTWTEPADIFHEIQSPGINPECLPECLREWMVDTAAVKGVDPAMLALSAIVASAGVLHDAIKIQPERTNPSWRESARLWGAIVGSSGIKKSPAIGAAVSRLKKIQLELSERAIELYDEVKSRELAYELANKGYIKALSTNDPSAADKKPFKPEPIEIPRLLFEDVTVQKLGDELRYSQRGAFVLRDELAGWFGSHSQYRTSGSDAPDWLDFYEGGPKYIDRIGRGSMFVKNFGGCILGGIQPSTLERILDKLPEDGLLQRFMVVNAKNGTDGNGLPYNKAAADRYHIMLQRIFDFTPGDNAILLSEEADIIRKEITAHARKLINSGMVSTGFCSHLAKYEGLAARLMLTFHTIEWADKGQHPQGCHVSGETAKLVQRFMLEFLLPHAIAFYINLTAKSEIGHGIRKVGELCLIAKDYTLATRDIAAGWIGWRHYKPQDQETVLQALVDSGWILPHPRARLSSRGHPTRWLINPRLQESQAKRKTEELERRKIAMEAIEQCRVDCMA